MRILITGSRDWTPTTKIERVVLEYHQVDAQGFDLQGVEMPTLVSGACPTGVDRACGIIAKFLGWTLELHPANWEEFGKYAGPKRNKEMVELGADVCLAFLGNCSNPRCKIPLTHSSHGASGTANYAELAGIPTRRFYPSVSPS